MRTKDWKKQIITIEGCRYTIEYCYESEEIMVQQPAKVLVGFRKTIGNNYPEVCTYLGIGIETDIAQLLIGERPKGQGPLINGEGDDIKIPKCLTTIKEVELEDSTFTIAYDWKTDLIVIQVPELVTHQQIKTLEVGHNELRVMHGGLLLEAIYMFILEVDGEKDLNLEHEF